MPIGWSAMSMPVGKHVVDLAGDIVGRLPVAVLHRVAREQDQHVVEALGVGGPVDELVVAGGELLRRRAP